MDKRNLRRLLIYRMGSLGDTVVALPVFHMLAREFADAERRVLTNFPVNSDAAPIQSVLDGSGLVHGYFPYPLGTRNPRALLSLRRDIAAWQPDMAVYLTPRRGLALRRDLLFLRLCGVRRIAGAPGTADLQRHRKIGGDGLWEAEADRLARCVANIGRVDTAGPAGWSLNLTAEEKSAATATLSGWPGAQRFAALSVGAKIDFKDWGDNHWASLSTDLSARHPDLGLVLIGGANDFDRSDAVAQGWRGPVLNLCGRLSPRHSACVIGEAELFMGHDSGPMHLAASIGTPAVCVFATLAQPGIWFPFGKQHRVFYPGLAWSGGDPPVMRAADGEANITRIPVAPVLEACEELLKANVA